MNKKIMLATIGVSAMISFANAQETMLTSVQTGDVDPSGSVSTCVSIDNNLRYKMKDTTTDGDVNTLQDFLISGNYMSGQPTGFFGLATLKAVKLFQQRQGLSPVSGYVGPMTRDKIKAVSCATDTGSTGGSILPMMDSTQTGTQNNGPKPENNPGREQGQPGKGQASDRMRASSTGMMGAPGMQNNPLAKELDTLVSAEDKATIKAKEGAVKVLKDSFKEYYLSNGGSQGTQITDAMKTEMKTKTDTIIVAEKDLGDTRKAILDKVKSTLSDEQKKKIDQMMSKMPQPTGSTTQMRPPVKDNKEHTLPVPMQTDGKKIPNGPDGIRSNGDTNGGTTSHGGSASNQENLR